MSLLIHTRLAVPPTWRDILAAVWQAGIHRDPSPALIYSLGQRLGTTPSRLFVAARYALAAYLRTLPRSRRTVLIPAFGCTILADAVRAAGFEPRLVDIDLDRYGMCPTDLARKIDDAAAVVAVHEFGVPFDPRVVEIVRGTSGVTLVEDAAVAVGATRAGGRPIGQEGDAVLVSGGLGKPLSSVSFGALASHRGDIGTTNERYPFGLTSLVILAASRILSNAIPFSILAQGIDFEAGRSELYDHGIENAQPTRFDMAILLRALQELEESLAVRARIAGAVLPIFARHGWRGPAYGDDRPVFGRLPLEIPKGLAREKAIAVFRANGIDLSIPGRRSLLMRVETDRREAFPNTARAEARLLALTTNPNRPDPHDLQERVERALRMISETRG